MDYATEPPHSGLLVIQGTEPLNAEPNASALVEFPLTPEDLVYCRNHGPVREFDEEKYVITVNGGVARELEVSMRDLRSLFPKVHVVAALQVPLFSLTFQGVLTDREQCAGNRRKEMSTFKKVHGILWDDGVIANAKWGGVRLADVLNFAGVKIDEHAHVCFASYATLCQDDEYYGASISLPKALNQDGEVLLAFEVMSPVLSSDWNDKF